MDSKYACINGGPSTPMGNHKFSLKRKWNGNGNTPNPMFKKQFTANGQDRNNNGASTPHKPQQQQQQQTNGQTPNGNSRAVPQLSLMDQRRALPVFQVRPKLMQSIAKNHTLIVLGETGSGKTTQIPQFLCDAGYADLAGRQIAVTQPRRVAAITLATRVAQEAGCRLGERVGYTVRFEDCTSARTKIKYMTDGTLLREALGDRLLRRYSVIVLDEAHERTINTDVLFGIIKAAQKARAEQSATGGGPLRVLIMSATMDVDHFARYFGGCECVYLQGRAHPVQVLHAREQQPEYTHACVSTLFDIHKSAPANHDVLIFLTGQEEIEHTATQIRTIAKSPEMQSAPRLLVHTLYSQQSQQKQLDVFRTTAPGARKVILCTNIAETSLTIRGIRYVIDSGRVKRAAYNPLTGMDTLRVERIAQDQAWQRTGRAGREAAGHCYRVYPMAEYKAMSASTQPEILRSSIVVTVLQLAAIGIDCAGFDFLDKPDAQAVAVAMRALHALGALASPTAPAVSLTPIGKKMARFPLDPRFARMLLAAPELGCLDAMLSIVAVLSGETVFVEPPVDQETRVAALQAHAKFDATHGDHQTLLNVFRAFEASAGAKMWCSQNWLNWRNLNYAREVRAQLRTICVQMGLMEESGEAEGKQQQQQQAKKAKLNQGVRALETAVDNGDADEDDDDDDAAKAAAAAIDAEAEDEAVRRCLLAGLFANVAELTSDGHTYKTRGPGARQRVKIHPTSRAQRAGRPPCVLYTELIVTGQCYMRHVTAVEAEWLPEVGGQQQQQQQTGKRS